MSFIHSNKEILKKKDFLITFRFSANYLYVMSSPDLANLEID